MTPNNLASTTSTTLDLVRKGSSCIVRRIISKNLVLKSKLLAMGIVSGTVIEVAAVAPLGDPVTIKALGYSLALRLSEAHGVEVTPLAK
jgi:ferrous iron transport protein A